MLISSVLLCSPKTPPSPGVPSHAVLSQLKAGAREQQLTRNPNFFQHCLPSACRTTYFYFAESWCFHDGMWVWIAHRSQLTQLKEKGWCSYVLSPTQFKSLLIQSELCPDAISPKLKIPQTTRFITCLTASSLSLLASKTRENTLLAS